jgi:hypothetical protein
MTYTDTSLTCRVIVTRACPWVDRPGVASPGVSDEGGQASVEWTALMLIAGLALAALGMLVPSGQGKALGRLVAQRVVCAVRGECDDAGGEGAVRARRASLPRPAARGAVAAPRRPRTGGTVGPRRQPRRRALDAFRRLRGVGTAARGAWIVCLGYRRFRYDLVHPRAPTESIPLRAAFDILNDCLNPVAFFGEG